MRNTGVQEFLRTFQVNTRQWKRTGSDAQHLNQIVSDGDGEKIRRCEATSKVGIHRRAGKIRDFKSFTRKSTRDTNARWENWGKGTFFCTNPLVINFFPL